MRKLIEGIMKYRRQKRPEVLAAFAKLALGQNPDCLFIACSDSRVAANVFASTDPGDLFVVRNVGNIVPAFPDRGSTVAALEFALKTLGVPDVVVCGHSDCGAIRALARGEVGEPDGPLSRWLHHAIPDPPGGIDDLDVLSRRNVAFQLDNLRSHPLVREREASGELRLHGLWFDIRQAEVSYLDEPPQQFSVIDDIEGERILRGLKK